uniref:Uncharacterized protein n=1 Tax=Oryza sativa subsp. japonica TaxID=39947 RepID=Q6YZZ9_ORYSJ|nr:unknown protein [Oryza sativa Japonica Group]BAD05728.1 unknown protein [Oryza sativa Japonica Group]
MGRRWHALAAVGVAACAAAAVAAGDRGFTFADAVAAPEEVGYMRKVVNFLWSGEASYHHVWPRLEV